METNSTTPQTIAQAITAFRELRKLGKRSFALRLGVTRQTVISWENGRSLPSVGTLHTIAAEAPDQWAREWATALIADIRKQEQEGTAQ